MSPSFGLAYIPAHSLTPAAALCDIIALDLETDSLSNADHTFEAARSIQGNPAIFNDVRHTVKAVRAIICAGGFSGFKEIVCTVFQFDKAILIAGVGNGQDRVTITRRK